MKPLTRNTRAAYGLLLPLFFLIFCAPSSFTGAVSNENNHLSSGGCCGLSGAASSNVSNHQTHAFSLREDDKKILSLKTFEQFKKFEGAWVGKSTKGWEDETTIKVVAAGSVVQMTSFGAHPNETMLTLFAMDVDKLRLTHYCVAKNQPRLEATLFEDDGRTVTFTFIEGGNLPTRDIGHMDKVVYRFKDDNTFSSQWTWYKNGKEDWLEEIVMKRKE